MKKELPPPEYIDRLLKPFGVRLHDEIWMDWTEEQRKSLFEWIKKGLK